MIPGPRHSAARVIAEAVDPDANIISGMVIDEEMDDDMKVTVIATGFDRVLERERPTEVQAAVARARVGRRTPNELAPALSEAPPPRRPERPRPEERPRRPVYEASAEEGEPPAVASPEPEEEIPFYRRAIASQVHDDPGGYGPNWSNVDDYDIPTVLRKQMD